jgi:hypothetical protein
MIENLRQSLRVRENKRVLWHVRNTELIGYGRVRDISTSGMLLELTSPIRLAAESLFSFDSSLRPDNFIPNAGRLAWQKKKRFARNTYLCGIQFSGVSGEILSRLRQRVMIRVNDSVRVRRLSDIVGAPLMVAFVVLAGYAAYLSGHIYKDLYLSNQNMFVLAGEQAALTRVYQRFYAETAFQLEGMAQELDTTTYLYQESQRMLGAASRELEAVKALLVQTEAMLTFAQRENIQIKKNQETVLQLQARDGHLTDELARAKNELDKYSADISGIQEGKRLIDLYHEQIKAVKAQIRDIKGGARRTRIAALRERDKVKMLIGNNGYMIKDGQMVKVDMEQYQQAQNLNALPVASPSAPPRVKVDVTVFQ